MINRFGRRTIFLYGLLAIFVSLLIVGFLSLGQTSSDLSWTIGAFPPHLHPDLRLDHGTSHL